MALLDSVYIRAMRGRQYCRDNVNHILDPQRICKRDEDLAEGRSQFSVNLHRGLTSSYKF